MEKQRKETELSVLQENRDLLKQLVGLLAPKAAEVKIDDRFTKLADGWIKDTKTGLEWGPGSEKELKWDDAKKYCADQGGRLPTVRELEFLIDRKKHDPATSMPGMKSSWYWTSEEVAWNTASAWCVDFGYGYVSWCGKDYGYYVRPVRSSQ
jgi:hypothetical protein